MKGPRPDLVPRPGSIAYVGAKIIDGTGDPPIEDGVVTVVDGRIGEVGPRGSVSLAPDIEVVDVSGRTIMPGMVNAHDHLAQPDPEDAAIPDYAAEKDTTHTPVQRLHTYAVRYGRQELLDGVTTVRVLGEKDGLDFGYKDAFDRGLVPGPRVIPSGPALSTSMSHGDIISTVINGPVSARAAVRDNIGAGAEVIKLFISGGRTLGVPYHLTTSFLSQDEIVAAIDEAHKFGVRVTAHLNGGPAVAEAIDAGLDSIEHGMEMSQEEIELVARTGTWVVLTLGWHFTPSYRQNLGDQTDIVRHYVVGLREAGIRVALGNDCCHADHGMARQVRWLTQFGYSAMEAIVIATRSTATACGIEDRRGSLRAGLDADLLILAADPLTDIDALWSIETVIKGGHSYRVH
jgi:imidazolonepropionase-like amidohydrolase